MSLSAEETLSTLEKNDELKRTAELERRIRALQVAHEHMEVLVKLVDKLPASAAASAGYGRHDRQSSSSSQPVSVLDERVKLELRVAAFLLGRSHDCD